MTDQEISYKIDKLHLRTLKKLYPKIKEEFPNVTKEDVSRVLKTKIKDVVPKDAKKYFNPVFASHLNAWMTDLLENQKSFVDNAAPGETRYRYFMIWIHINSRYAEAYPVQKKTIAELLPVLQHFVDTHKVSSITSDGESALTSEQVVNYLKTKNITLRIVEEQQHGSLAIVDRFIRTLRDMNIPSEKSKKMSWDERYRNFTEKRMNKLLQIYNTTVHGATKTTPEKMYTSEKMEIAYIAAKLHRKYRVQHQEGYKLNDGDYCRVIIPKDPLQKRRFKISREAYKIAGKFGNMIQLEAEDGKAMQQPRWRIIPLGSVLPNGVKFATTINGVTEKYCIEKIVAYNANVKNCYQVEWSDGSKTWQSMRSLRGRNPTTMSRLEKIYFLQHPN